MRKKVILGLIIVWMANVAATAQSLDSTVKVVGAMKNVMWKGQLYGTISLDTISPRQHLYGLGPVEYLAGEISIIDGHAYRSTVLTDSTMQVDETFELKAPFFVYASVENWNEQNLPDSIQSIPQLENYLNQITQNATRPFAFRLSGIVDEASIHVVNLPKGSMVRSPQEAHQGLKSFQLSNREADIIGFFSTVHQAIFTHHNSFVHMHILTKDKKQMGHLDEVLFKKGAMKLYLPTD